MGEVFLNDGWSLYYHDPYSTDWSVDSYIHICDISSVKSFCAVMKAIDNHWRHGNFFIFREHITPRWEDENNMDGGCYSIKINADEFQERLFDICAGILGETVAINKEHTLNINGISTTPKKNSFIIRIWLKDNNIANREFYNIPCSKFSPIMYKKHKE